MDVKHNIPPQIDDLWLRCPHCGNTFIHHDLVTVFTRLAEDHDGFKTTCAPNTITSSPAKDEVMPGRRDSLQMQFWCEACGLRNAVLSILQHKGQTLVAWDISRATASQPLQRP